MLAICRSHSVSSSVMLLFKRGLSVACTTHSHMNLREGHKQALVSQKPESVLTMS